MIGRSMEVCISKAAMVRLSPLTLALSPTGARAIPVPEKLL
jgi:hypothetical protein